MASIKKFIWRTATSGTPQRSVLGPILFKIFNDLMMRQSLSRFSHDKKLGEMVMSECYAAIQRNLDKHEEWEDKNLMEFNNVKCKVLPMDKSKQMHWYILGNN